MNELKAALLQFLPQEDVLENESMAQHTTFRAGGAARLFVYLRTQDDLKEALRTIVKHRVPYTVVGNGSNLLVADAGYHGVVLCMKGMRDVLGRENTGERFSVSIKPDTAEPSPVFSSVSFSAGTLNSEIAAYARDNSLSGYAFAAGIPGTLGGARIMNAGAYGGEMKDIVTSVNALHVTGDDVEEITFSCEEMQFGYRTSRLKGDASYIITGATLHLTPGDKDEIATRMKELAEKRRDKQPLEYASAGSTFKRPEGQFAGALIEAAGCKGLSIGDAQISEKHAGFLINRGSASATEIYRLIRMVQDRVLEHSGISLEPEVVLLGDFTL